MKELLIDGDILLYQYGCTNESVIDWGEGITSEWNDFNKAKAELDSFLVNLQLQTHTQNLLICFSHISSPSFRYEILPTYKHNRIGKEKPKLYYDLRQYLFDNYRCIDEPRLEADDLLGIYATQYPGKYIIASIDKDLKQIPGDHYNWQKRKRFKVTEEQADRWFYTQILTGDSTDGYSGCPKIGPKTAKIVLDWADYLWSISDEMNFEKIVWSCILNKYKSKNLTDEYALTQARVARILRYGEYNFETKQIIFWTPETSKGK